MRRPSPTIAVTLAIAVFSCAAAASEPSAPSYNADIRPILVENCFSCHGADTASRQAGLRLDRRDDAVASGAIVPGDPDSSVMLDRIFSDDPEEVMPPPAAKKTLTPEQKKLLQQWIAAGAEYEPHWSFIPPVRPQLPAVTDATWVRNPIDRFVLARLESEGLRPAPEADRRTLARRVALDLTGLPPDPAVVDAFVADPSADAYERLVDALLASLEWGEHRGRHWLDYARYADTHGIHIDNFREMWTYRQWVVNAFNRNLPFDRFTILQLAGDLVEDHGPGASPAQILDNRIASGFNRCNITTSEGGAIDEEYLVLYARDRTETTSAVWMGLTTGCAVCHDHKFDPLSQREFYELAAFFNNTTQKAMDGNVRDTPPILPVPAPEDRPRFTELEARIPEAKAAIDARREAARPEFESWLRGLVPESLPVNPLRETPLVALPFAEAAGSSTRVSLLGKETDVPLTAGTTWQAGPQRLPAILLDGGAAELPGGGDFEWNEPFRVTFWLRPSGTSTPGSVIARMGEAPANQGWDVWLDDRRVAMHLSHSWPEHGLKVVAGEQLPADAWTFVAVTYDGSGKPEGVTISYNGTPRKTDVKKQPLGEKSIKTSAGLTIGSRSKGGALRGVGLAELSIWGRALPAGDVAAVWRAHRLRDLVTLAPDERPAAAADLYDGWLAEDERHRALTAAVAALEAEMAEIRKRGTIAHVMHEKPEMPRAYVLDRGEYDKRKDEVKPETPDILPQFPESLPRNRLGLAQWLLLGDHPLTTRVTVNRFWQEVFGTGLVRTSGDFGITGELPSHPELLDWLAVEFREGGWDIKRLFRLMVTSAAYRQAASATPEKLAKDAANRLLSRGPRFRMDAEMVRDHALAASGLLVRQIGGPSVRPYQPEGVWEAVAMDNSDTRSYVRDKGEGLYRRSMYWFWKRSAPPASMDIFNAPSRENCCIKRERTNTPLQALVTLNDPQFVEAARALADRALELGAGDDQRLAFIAERLLARRFSAAELPIVKKSLADLSAWYAAHPDDARTLITVGDSKPRATDAVQLASWTMLTNELMNLDEVLCK